MTWSYPGPGRPKGVPNKIAGTCKENISRVFDELGGVPAMVAWAQENATDFYKIYGKMLPLKLEGDSENPVEIKVTFVNAC